MKFVITDHYSFLKKFYANDVFINLFVYGPKGSGKTKTLEQIHKDLGKKIFRVNVTIESDEDSLIGGLRLKDGGTFFEKGPVIKAMEEGGTLLLDEIDMGHPQRLMCLQSILEGSGYLIKRTGEFIVPKKGFKIVATANTKGHGDDETGEYVGAQILNGAMKDRFAIFYEFGYPSEETEISLLKEIRDYFKTVDFPSANGEYIMNDEAIAALVKWSAQLRIEAIQNDIDGELVSTRKLIDIIKTNFFLGNLKESIRYCISSYPNDVKDSFMDTWDIITGDKVPVAPKQSYKTF